MVRRNHSTVRNVSLRCDQTPTSITHENGAPQWIESWGPWGKLTAPVGSTPPKGRRDRIYGWDWQSGGQK